MLIHRSYHSNNYPLPNRSVCNDKREFSDPCILPSQEENYYWNSKRSTIKRVVNGHFVNCTFCYTCFT